ncbi:MAG: hypothetical protein H0U06_04825 [Solirubrobacterales bacterium]|nr:hypothetical protein [Solirubrobacterales bacterium]
MAGDDLPLVATVSDLDDIVDARDALRLIAQLKPQQRLVLLLRAEGHSYKAICELTDRTYTWVICGATCRRPFFSEARALATCRRRGCAAWRGVALTSFSPPSKRPGEAPSLVPRLCPPARWRRGAGIGVTAESRVPETLERVGRGRTRVLPPRSRASRVGSGGRSTLDAGARWPCRGR